jgi:hypothetical protein
MIHLHGTVITLRSFRKNWATKSYFITLTRPKSTPNILGILEIYDDEIEIKRI